MRRYSLLVSGLSFQVYLYWPVIDQVSCSTFSLGHKPNNADFTKNINMMQLRTHFTLVPTKAHYTFHFISLSAWLRITQIIMEKKVSNKCTLKVLIYSSMQVGSGRVLLWCYFGLKLWTRVISFLSFFVFIHCLIQVLSISLLLFLHS